MNTIRRVVRRTLGAGKWFPGIRSELATVIRAHLDNALPPPLGGPLVALVAPHAGYLYSGPVAGYAYRVVRDQAEAGQRPDTVVVLGFSHHGDTQGVALMEGDALASPLGETALDADAANLLAAADPRIIADYRPHNGEHSLENQVPFIQTVLPEASLVMALVGERDSSLLDALAHALQTLAAKKRILVVASSDMLHDASHERVRKTDHATLRKMLAMDTTGLLHDWDYSQQILCGIGPVVAAMRYACLQSIAKGTLLKYRNSGDDHPECRGQWVVGYGAVAF